MTIINCVCDVCGKPAEHHPWDIDRCTQCQIWHDLASARRELVDKKLWAHDCFFAPLEAKIKQLERQAVQAGEKA